MLNAQYGILNEQHCNHFNSIKVTVMNRDATWEKNKDNPGLYKQIKDTLYLFISVIAAIAIFHWLVLSPNMVVSSSMAPTLQAGDYILVSKMHYGARTPITPIQMPLTHGTIPWTNKKSYWSYIKLPYFRLPGFSSIKRNDVIVFNQTVDHGVPIDLGDFWVKRCIALPSDVVSVNNKDVFVNDQPADNGLYTTQYAYFMSTKRHFPPTFFEKNGISDFTEDNDDINPGYTIHTNKQTIDQMLKVLKPSAVGSIEPKQEAKGVASPQIYPQCDFIPWNKDNFGPFVVPKKGMTITMDKYNTALYGYIIQHFEGNSHVSFDHDGCWINDQPIETYTFRKNYYFVVGDNRDNSKDSRFIGPIPEEYICGKAVMILYSCDRTKNPFNPLKYIRWNRLLKSIH